MPTKKFTGAVLKHIKPLPGEARTKYFDSEYAGLCLRVGARDKTWCYYYRFAGRKQYDTLGKYALGRVDHMDRDAAKKAAGVINGQVEQGINPQSVGQSVKTKPTVKNPNSLDRRVKQYLKLYKGEVKPPTYDQAKRILSGDYVESLKHTDVSTISRVQLVELLEGMADTPAMSNRVHAYLGKFFNWCWDRGYVDPSPMAGLKKRFKEKPRKRHLDAAEIKQLWKACLKLGYPLGDWCRFTLATGQRPGECRNLSRYDIHNGVWLVEGGDPKNAERHRIPLPKLARDIIRSAPKFDGPYVFTTTGGKKAMTQGGKPYEVIYKKVDMAEPWRPHDLRRTFHTIASEELDIEPHILGAICNQISVSKPGVAAIYNQAKWMKPKEEALALWNQWLTRKVK